MPSSVFLALLYRLRTTSRWSGMLALQPEDVAQHSFGVAVIAHMLCTIDEQVFERKPDTLTIVSASLLHDASEAILTDVIAPVKKYNPEVQAAFQQLEGLAAEQMVDSLPPELQPAYRTLVEHRDPVVADYVHAADKLDALLKCKMELRRGNQEFALAGQQIAAHLDTLAEHLPSVRYFLDTFVPAFEHSVDEYRYLR